MQRRRHLKTVRLPIPLIWARSPAGHRHRQAGRRGAFSEGGGLVVNANLAQEMRPGLAVALRLANLPEDRPETLARARAIDAWAQREFRGQPDKEQP